MKRFISILASICLAGVAFGQPLQVGKLTKGPPAKQTPPGTPSFSLAWSEYPSWSAFDVASTFGIIDGRKGYMSALESKYGVDVELKLLDYDPCIQAYSGSTVDAVCITNIDVLSPSLTRKAVAVLPTSTSYGGDALIVPTSITSFDDLKGQKVYGLGKSVSEYNFDGVCEANKVKSGDITFVNLDPGAAATAVQGDDKNVKNIVVWNPFVNQTLKIAKDKNGQFRTHVLADSRQIPLEIIDMVVIGEDSLSKPGGENFARCLADAYYLLNQRLADTDTRDDTLIAIGEKFSSLGLADMRKVVDQTRFFGTAQQGIDLFSNKPTSIDSGNKVAFKDIMTKVVARCVKLDMVPSKVVIGYGSDAEARKANLRFDPQYMTAAKPSSETTGTTKPTESK
jgi:hypothetical protein